MVCGRKISCKEPTRPHYGNVVYVTPIDLRQTGENHLIVATLVATVAFTAGFTMPGGYNGNDGPNQGMAILTREAAFKAFMVIDTIATSLSISAVLTHFYAAGSNNGDEVEKLVHRAAYLTIYAAMAMVLAFVTGTYAVLAHSSGLAISVCVIGCLPLLYFLNTRIMVLRGRCIVSSPQDISRMDLMSSVVSFIVSGPNWKEPLLPGCLGVFRSCFPVRKINMDDILTLRMCPKRISPMSFS
ncbi:hypothetical protein TEA_000254 [Camellia sinensis var. sinensis]|uniref:PGG domain-containing protein n=1 Tax=Camellia sinensis var. sinensis TaxID=542762 RepID=A0A4S4DU14_CAMSN|nr:hypothetical protein TEA_000254 [Camellia sinensis var. sinensis]